MGGGDGDRSVQCGEGRPWSLGFSSVNCVFFFFFIASNKIAQRSQTEMIFFLSSVVFEHLRAERSSGLISFDGS